MLGISWRMRLLAYNVRKLITAAPAIKHLTPALLAIVVTIYHHQLLAALHVTLSRHNASSAVMHRLAHPVIVVIIWATPPLV
jgi:hypothetical protein